MVDDHGRATEKLLAEVRELRDRVGMHEVLRKTVHEMLSKNGTPPSELTYESVVARCAYCQYVVQNNQCMRCGAYQACTECGHKFGDGQGLRENCFPAGRGIVRCQVCYDRQPAEVGS
jgi:hypothetical protein